MKTHITVKQQKMHPHKCNITIFVLLYLHLLTLVVKEYEPNDYSRNKLGRNGNG